MLHAAVIEIYKVLLKAAEFQFWRDMFISGSSIAASDLSSVSRHGFFSLHVICDTYYKGYSRSRCVHVICVYI